MCTGMSSRVYFREGSTRMFRPIVLLFLASLSAADLPWAIAELKKAPQTWDAISPEPGVRAVWLAGPPYQGKFTRAFAYYGIPEGRASVPGIDTESSGASGGRRTIYDCCEVIVNSGMAVMWDGAGTMNYSCPRLPMAALKCPRGRHAQATISRALPPLPRSLQCLRVETESPGLPAARQACGGAGTRDPYRSA